MKADLHIHTLLSPCGDIEMTPLHIVDLAKKAGLDIIGIADHNSTLQAREVKKVGDRKGLCVLCGAEITTKEEVHLLAFVEGTDRLDELQSFLSGNLPKMKNNPEFFGYQLVVNENEEVLHEEEYLLINAIDKTIEEVAAFVRRLGGIVIPAHIDKMQNSILSQLGFVPPELEVDALEITERCNPNELVSQHPYLKKYGLIRSSDAHYLGHIGSVWTELPMDGEPAFEAIKDAISKLSYRHE